MLRNFLKNRKAQNTAEYALLIALVVAGVIAMQTYAQRTLQARIHDASHFMATNTAVDADGKSIGDSTQYEPYYMNSIYTVDSNSTDSKYVGNNIVGSGSQSNRVREAGGREITSNTAGAN